MASTTTLQAVVKSIRAYPELTPVLGNTGGWTAEPALTIANDVMQRMLAQTMDWKFNRAPSPPFLTVALQQDYVSNVTDLGWLEQAIRVDINNNSNPNSPKPIFGMEAVRDISQSSWSSNPFNISWLPNTVAVMGTWQANTKYFGGYGVAQTPITPIQQFKDSNGNILFINSYNLGLSINSLGISNTGVQPTLPGPNPYGTSGSVQPVLPISSAPGTTVTDGTVTWTVANPNGVAFRLAPIPASSGIVWWVTPIYQMKPPIITSLQQILSPIPDEFIYLFRQGFLAMCYGHAGSKQFRDAYQMWEEAMMLALKSADREREDANFYPSESLTGAGAYGTIYPIGAGWPYGFPVTGY